MDLLDTSALLETLPSLLPFSDESPGESTSNASTVKLRQPQDALASLLHTILTRLDFRLIGLGEDHRLDQQSEDDGDESNINSSRKKKTKNQLPKDWNSKGPDTYSFRYRHDQSSLEFIIKTVKLAGRVIVHGIAAEDNKTYSFDITTSDYFSPSFFPWPNPSSSSSSTGSKEPLVNGFISSSRVKDLTNTFKIQIIKRLIPGLRKEGYQESPAEGEGSGSNDRRGGGGDDNNRQPPLVQPNRPEYEPPPNRPQEDYRQPPFRNPLIIGDRDLDPLGGGGGFNNPLALPGRGGGGGFGPPPLFGGGDNGGGMYVGPNHPIFRDRFQNPDNAFPGAGGGIGPMGGNNFLPPGAVPPGARFDPIGPGGPFPDPRGGFGPARGGGGGAGRGRGRGDPDWNDLRPPSGNDFDHMFG